MEVNLIDFKTEDDVCLNGFISKAKDESNKKIVIATNGMSSNLFRPREKYLMDKFKENNISYFAYNNRGSDLVKYVNIEKEGKISKKLGGTSYENVTESYFDIKSAIIKAKELGYKNIYLQGHSLGSTKTLYAYNKIKEENPELLENIKGVILLSLVDIPNILKIYLSEKFEEYVEYAEMKEKEGKEDEIMPKHSFIHPISVKTFLIYAKKYQEFDFARYSENEFDFKELNNIDAPLFMRWGNVKEMIAEPAEDIVKMLNQKIKNENKDINYIDGADHGYNDRLEELSSQIINFIKQY